MRQYKGRTIRQILAYNELRPVDNEAAREIGTYVYHTFKNHKDFRKFRKSWEDGQQVNCYHMQSVKVVAGIVMNFVLRHPELVKRKRARIKKPT